MLGTKIKQLRKNNNLTQDEFGQKLLHTKSTISKWENNQAIPDIATLKKISDLFELDLNSLIKDIEPKPKPKKETKLLFKWDKVNYSGNANLVQKNHKIIFNIAWITFALIGLALCILPLAIAQDNYGNTEVILCLVGTFGLCVDIIWVSIIVRRSNKKSFENRWNVKFELFEDKIKITSVTTGGVKLIEKNHITSITSLGQDNNIQVKIILNNNKVLNLFKVDRSVFNNLNDFKKGGTNE